MKTLGAFLLGLAVTAALLLLGGYAGYAYRGTLCQTAVLTDQAQAETKQKAITKADLNRAYQAGARHERNRQGLDKFFDQLTREAANDPPDPVDDCRLPDDRLRRWNAANAGRPDQGQSARQPDDGAAGAAASGIGADTRSGGEPPGGRQELPRAGEPVLQPAAVPGADAR